MQSEKKWEKRYFQGGREDARKGGGGGKPGASISWRQRDEEASRQVQGHSGPSTWCWLVADSSVRIILLGRNQYRAQRSGSEVREYSSECRQLFQEDGLGTGRREPRSREGFILSKREQTHPLSWIHGPQLASTSVCLALIHLPLKTHGGGSRRD